MRPVGTIPAGGVPRRTPAPFGRRLVEVAANGPIGAYRLLSALDAGTPAPRPGQFYMLASERRWGGGEDERPYLSRAFSHCRVHGDGRLDFLIEAVGPGTRRLAELQPGERLWLVGPLGIGFDLDLTERPLLVGGGVGVAPLVALADALGSAAECLLGFRSADHAAAAALLRAGAPAIATDDGSVGRHALVTELLRERMHGPPIAVYACGPPPMLEAVRALCAASGVRAQLALEAGMACGYGACYGCVHPTRAGYLRLCVDGPVLEADALETALGAGAPH